MPNLCILEGIESLRLGSCWLRPYPPILLPIRAFIRVVRRMERDYRRRWWTPWRFLMMLLLCFVVFVFLTLCLRVIFEISSFLMENRLVFHFSSKYFNESFVIFEIFERTCSILTSLIVVMESLYKCCPLRIENIPCYKAGWYKVNFLKKKKRRIGTRSWSGTVLRGLCPWNPPGKRNSEREMGERSGEKKTNEFCRRDTGEECV